MSDARSWRTRMTTTELIERGIGHNCLSDAYDLGRHDAEKELKALGECEYNKGAEDFGKWLANGNVFIRRIGSEEMKTIDEHLAEWQKEVTK